MQLRGKLAKYHICCSETNFYEYVCAKIVLKFNIENGKYSQRCKYKHYVYIFSFNIQVMNKNAVIYFKKQRINKYLFGK